MSLEEIEWTESEGDTDDNLALEDYSGDSADEHELDRELDHARDAGVRSRRTRDEELDPEVEMAYQDARNLYTSGDYNGALILLEEAIKHEASSKLLFNLLASIHEERHDFEKALLARIAVAHLDKRDKDTWIDIAERSEQLGHLSQAAVFYQHVLRLDRGNWAWLWKRADLNLQLGETSTALMLLQRLRSKFFAMGDDVGLDHQQKTQVLLTIASALKDLGRIDEATKIYWDIYHRSLSAGSSAAPEVELDWQNLNVLCELLADQKLFWQVITTIKNGARWIHGRSSESFWVQFNRSTDAEFDERREALLAKLSAAQQREVAADDEAQFELPIDIRIWLLESRLKVIPSHLLLNAQNTAVIENLPTVADALVHMAKLQECKPVESYSDLYRRGAAAFFEARLYLQARELYIALTDISHETMEEYLKMTVQVAKCEMELHNLERAESLYGFVLERDAENQEALVAMGEIYAATDRQSESMAMLLRLENVRGRLERGGALTAGPSASLADAAGAAGTGAALVAAASSTQAAAPAMHKHVNTTFTGAGNIFVGGKSTRAKAVNSRATRAQIAELERNAQMRSDAAFSGLARFQSGLGAGNAVATKEWLRHADDLVDMFASHRKFFPVDRQKEFFAFEGSSNSSIDTRIARLRLAQEDQLGEQQDEAACSSPVNDRSREEFDEMIDDSLQEPGSDSTASLALPTTGSGSAKAHQGLQRKRAGEQRLAQPSREELEDTYIWRGQPLSTWFLVLMQAALVHAKQKNSDRAQQIVIIAQAANVFSLNEDRSGTMQFVALSCAHIAGDATLLGDLLRHMQVQFQFNTVTYRLYVALLAQGRNEVSNFGSSNNQKFFLRQIKALDSVVHHKAPVVGMAKVMDPAHAPGLDDPQLLMLYVYIMLLGPSFTPALLYLIRTRGVLPRHPLVLLTYGVTQVHSAIQRTSANRHLQLLEGLSFMQDYVEERTRDGRAEKLQETHYNMGRFFHSVGLLSHAVRYYEKALALRDQVEDPAVYDFSREAAYNLHLIYAEDGNMTLSAGIVDEYLVI